ncbi:ATP-binding protein [Carboxylicivirga sp. N1Y90]|uniref:ATP-binding protein n=1 Tax=Carboxylicivirga fragile TaxID=3417571 RepID=UPI003D3256E7|nr:ATP-binding protein [Marinilabiliaceae bacterium N1Y90]
MEFNYEVEGGNFAKAGNAASSVKKVLKQLNVDPKVIKRVVVALYEGEVNVVAHAYKGNIMVDIDTARIFIRIQDEGPGIPDIDLAMTVGYSTASAMVREMGFGAGMGLPNMKRNADSLKLSSKVGEGTIVELTTNLSK